MPARGFAVVLALLAVPAPPAAAQQPEAGARPNIVLIVTDDLGYGDIGSYGAPDVRTPNIDRLAKEGVRLTDFYANGATCTPTRAALVSGRYQQRFELERPLGTGVDTGLPAEGTSLPRLVKASGYTTGLVGKWHLGERPQFSPGAHGFDYFFGFKSGYIDYYQHTAADGMGDLFENDAPVRVDGYMTDLITERSVRFIEQHARDRFFLEVAYNAPHWPYQVPDRPSIARDDAIHLHAYDPDAGTRQDYVAMFERVDRGVGAILASLDTLGLANGTLVIFTNDNGGEWLSRNAPLFHRKHTLWEGGIRVPAILRWPGRLPAGRVSEQVAVTFDLTASILAATGTPPPAPPGLDGINLLPILGGESPVVERTLFWRTLYANRRQFAVRSGDWKLLIDGESAFVFNLRNDIGERNDLARERQDVARRLRPLIAGWVKDVDAEAKARRTRTGR
jgi:arylsulfatase A-like enzyme